MCEKDGGVAVYEKTRITAKEAKDQPRIAGSISIPHQALATSKAPLVFSDADQVLKESGPKVVRRERVVIRQSDQKVVGKIVNYSRIGGDMPTGFSEGSSFTCPAYESLYSDQARFFSIVEEK